VVMSAWIWAACSSEGDGGGGGAAASAGATGGSGAAHSGGGGSHAGGTHAGGTHAGGSGAGGGLTTPNECATPDGAWIFCCDFETGDFSQWDDYDGNPAPDNTIQDEPGPFNLQGNRVARLRVPPGRGGADMVKVLPPHDRLYARWYVQWEPGFDMTAPNHGSGLHAGDRNWLGHSDTRPAGDDWFSSWIEHTTTSHTLQAYSYYRGMYQDCADPNGQCWGDTFPCTVDDGQTYCTKPEHRETVMPPVMVDGQWYCLELTMDGGTPSVDGSVTDGQLDFWIDGQEMGPWTDLWLRTTADLQLDVLWLSLFHHGDHSVEGMFFDNVVVSTERVGCP
jgi:hypothetical protein